MSTEITKHSEAPENTALSDLRARAMQVPVEVLTDALAEYKGKRKAFRDWLQSQLVEGVHFGFPPGTEPKRDEMGNYLVWVKNGFKPISPKQWTPKPSLYKAGADFVCDLLGARDEYEADNAAWEQLGSVNGTFVMSCKLVSRSNGDIIGEGRGCYAVGTKKMDANAAIKMAKKSAKVDAVLSAYGLADLFTQDIEDMTQPPHDNPERNGAAATVQPRGERITAGQLNALYADWQVAVPNESGTKDEFCRWCNGVVGRQLNNIGEWTQADYAACVAIVSEKMGGIDGDRKPTV